MELQELICKCCTAPLDPAKATGRVIRCVHCGTAFIMAKSNRSKVQNFLDQGEHDLDNFKFDEAYTAYAKAAELDSEEPEAYFGMALSTFKVQYLKDEANDPPRLQPICHEVTDKKFTENANYRRALALATAEQRKEYEKRGEEIDYILGEFFKLKQSGLDYDCFLCVKVTDGVGKTEDSKDADYIYGLLRDKGYRPFYSERELRNVAGADYEARILYALCTSECMLVICRDESYLQTKWVKNEYMRFLKLVNDAEKESDSITIVFCKKPIERLPGRRGKLQGIDFSLREADGKIVDFVETHTPEAKKRREEEKKKKRQEEEAQKRQIEEMRQQLAENERRAKEEAERRAQEEEARNREREEMRAMIDELKRGNAPQQPAAPAGNFSPEQLLAMLRQAEEEEKRRKEEAERKKREEEARLAAEKRAREEAERIAREEAARRARAEEEKRRAYFAQFEIANGVLKKYTGQGGDLIIPGGVTEIGKQAFNGCRGLTGVTIPAGVTLIGEKAFDGCSGLTSITIPGSMRTIQHRAFGDCSGLTSVTINGESEVKTRAFEGCTGLRSLTIGSGVRSIEKWAFDGCSGLTSIAVAKENKTYRGEGNCIIEEATNKLVLGCINSVIPDSVTSIGEAAFGRCTGLTNIVIPKKVAFLEEYAFGLCRKLASCVIPNSVISIERGTFFGCENLKYIEIPDSVTFIGDEAFANCPNLKSVTIPKRFKGGIMKTELKRIFGEGVKSIQFTFTD